MPPMTVRHRRFWLTLIAAAAVAGCGGSDADEGVRVEGALDRPATVTAFSLATLSPVTQTVNYTAAGTPQTRTYTGPTLWNVLSGMGIQTNSTPKNDVLNRYVMATSTDGYRGVFALGELHPDYGNKAALLAYAETRDGKTAPIGDEDGPFRVTAPGDVKGGRYLSNVIRLDVRSSGSTVTASGGGTSPSFAVSGAVLRPLTYDAAALQALPSSTYTVGANSYSGVSLWTLLNTDAGLKPDNSTHNPSIRMYAVATGSDGYKAVVTLGEIDPGFGKQPALIATSLNGAPLGNNGVARLVLPNDVKASRSVSNLVAIEVFVAPVAP